MRSRRILPLLALAAVVVGGAGLWRWRQHRAQQVTFTRDVAPITLAKCAPCHRPGEAGPFNLLTYEDVSRKAGQIRKVTSRRFMPPWKPAPGSVAFVGDRSLTDAQIDVFARWATQGAPRGDPADMPPIPKWPEGWQLGKPDLVVQLPRPYALRPEGTDVYRNFVIPAAVTGSHYVTAWEFRAGSRAIHHAILNVDRLGLARKHDGEDGEMGFSGMDVGNVQSADGFYLVWAPGVVPSLPNPARGWRIDEHTDLVLQLHMQPRGKPETINPVVGLYFGDRPPTERLVSVRVGDNPIDIAPGDAHYVMQADITLPTDVDVISLFPHAHYLAQTFRSWATLPDHSTRELLRIDAWDFNWQDAYTYVTPVSLPAGTVVAMEVVYDNSEANAHNPSHPPRRVQTGEKSTDEMGNVTFQVIPRGERGEVKLRIAKYEHLLVQADTAKNQYNLANALADDGRVDEAIAHYLRATLEAPALAPAEFNLGNLLLARGDFDGAIVHFAAARKAQPDHFAAGVNLGHALEGAGRMKEALDTYREVIQADPRNVLAHASLGVALAHQGDRQGGIRELEAAQALAPDDARLRATLDGLRQSP
jgi:Flp pilus assembly protein TadD